MLGLGPLWCSANNATHNSQYSGLYQRALLGWSSLGPDARSVGYIKRERETCSGKLHGWLMKWERGTPRQNGLGVCPKIKRFWVRGPPWTKALCLRDLTNVKKEKFLIVVRLVGKGKLEAQTHLTGTTDILQSRIVGWWNAAQKSRLTNDQRLTGVMDVQGCCSGNRSLMEKYIFTLDGKWKWRWKTWLN